VRAYDAFRYVASVKREFAGQPERHEEFLAVLRAFRLGRLVSDKFLGLGVYDM
jgi:histone deacetylase complex regulatory component SIN3